MANLTQRAILHGFEEMLGEMSFSKITVSALVSRCEISPNTFYYHFRDIYDLLDTWLDMKKATFFQRQTGVNDYTKVLKAFFHALKEHPKLVYHVSDSLTRERMEQYVFVSLKSKFWEYIEKEGMKRKVDANTLHAFTDFCCYCFLGMTLEYVWGHMEADTDTMVDRMDTLFQGMLHTVLLEADAANAGLDTK